VFFQNYLTQKNLATSEILDLAEYNFPLFEERLKYQKSPNPDALKFSEKIKSSDGVLIVTPEYNGGYPASLKNIVDLLTDEWFRKPVAISTVSNGAFGGMQVITSIQFSLWKIGVMTVPALFPVPKIQEAFDENGEPTDKLATEKRAGRFLNELLWYIEARKRMENN